MKTIFTKTVLVNFKGEPLTDENKTEIKLGTILANVMAGKVSNPTLGWVLGKKFATEDEVDLKAEEIVFLRQEILKVEWLNAMIVGQVLEILDSPNESKKG